MKAAAKVAIRPKPPAPTPPKPPGTAPPKASDSQGPKASGAQGPKAPGAQGNKNDNNKNEKPSPPVRTPSGNLGQPPSCNHCGQILKLFRNTGGYTCDECGSQHTTHRCSAGCDFDLCQKCFFKKVNRAAPNIGKVTPIKTGTNANTPKAKGGIVRTNSGVSITPTGNQAKAGSISPQGNQAKAGSITPINRSASSPKLETSIAGGKIVRTNSSGNVQSPLARTNSGKGGTIKPAITPAGGEIKRVSSGTIIPSGGGDLKR